MGDRVLGIVHRRREVLVGEDDPEVECPVGGAACGLEAVRGPVGAATVTGDDLAVLRRLALPEVVDGLAVRLEHRQVVVGALRGPGADRDLDPVTDDLGQALAPAPEEWCDHVLGVGVFRCEQRVVVVVAVGRGCVASEVELERVGRLVVGGDPRGDL